MMLQILEVGRLTNNKNTLVIRHLHRKEHFLKNNYPRIINEEIKF